MSKDKEEFERKLQKWLWNNHIDDSSAEGHVFQECAEYFYNIGFKDGKR